MGVASWIAGIQEPKFDYSWLLVSSIYNIQKIGMLQIPNPT